MDNNSAATIYISEDVLLAEILIKLPVKSLVRFRCVCKSWNQIISSTSFINNAHTNNTGNRYLILTHLLHSYSLVFEDDDHHSSSSRYYYYTPESFGIRRKNVNSFSGVYIHGSCKGLLCVSHRFLYINSLIYLWNPIIRKAKRIPNIPCSDVERHGYTALCIGYVNDDYKVIRLAPFGSAHYRVGVYSLTTNSWKIVYPDRDNVAVDCVYPSSKFVSGVAYFWKYRGKIACFYLHDESIREVRIPEMLDRRIHSVSLEACGESICLMETSDGYLSQWVLTNSYSWEKKFSIHLQTTAFVCPVGFVSTSKYLLKYGGDRSKDIYLVCDTGKSEFEDFTYTKEINNNNNKKVMFAIEYMMGNLVLLNEENLDPLVVDSSSDPAACSTQTKFTLYQKRAPRNKGKNNMLHKTPKKLTSKRKRAEEEIEKK